MTEIQKKSRRKRILCIVLSALALCAVGCILYLSDCYRASDEVDAYLEKTGTVSVTELSNGLFLDGAGTDSALIFYPGAKVEYTAYVPLLYSLAERGTDVFLLKMPCNIALFGINRAGDIMDEYSYEHWYLGGHSLGGVAAAEYAAKRLKAGEEAPDGLLLLAAYPIKDLSESGMRVLTVYGSADGVLNLSRLEAGRALLPADAEELVLSGGNHAQFGCYGTQKGDGTAAISQEEQWSRTADAIETWIEGGM